MVHHPAAQSHKKLSNAGPLHLRATTPFFKLFFSKATWLLSGSLACGMTMPSYAASNLLNHASGVVTGQSSDHVSLFNGTYNPAMGDLMISPNEHWRLNYFFSLSSSTEFGQVDNFVDDIDDLIDILEDPGSTSDPVDITLDKFNNLITKAGKDGYLKTTNGGYLPAFPLYWRPSFLPGTLSFELNIETQIKLSVLNDTMRFDQAKETFSTATSAYIKTGIQRKFSVGYSQEIQTAYLQQHFDGHLLVGARLNIYDLELSKQVFQLQLLNGKDIEDVISDEYKHNRIQSTGIGLDFGAIWMTSDYRLGLSLTNLNAPSFDYGPVGINCDTTPEGSDQQSNCYIADYFATVKGQIKVHEQHKKNPVIIADGSYYLLSNWLVSGASELASYDDTVGTENQWINIATSYHPSNFWFPDVRIGYSKNMAGSKLSYANAGLTILGTFNLDLSIALDKVSIDDKSTPRGFGFSLSFEEQF